MKFEGHRVFSGARLAPKKQEIKGTNVDATAFQITLCRRNADGTVQELTVSPMIGYESFSAYEAAVDRAIADTPEGEEPNVPILTTRSANWAQTSSLLNKMLKTCVAGQSVEVTPYEWGCFVPKTFGPE